MSVHIHNIHIQSGIYNLHLTLLYPRAADDQIERTKVVRLRACPRRTRKVIKIIKSGPNKGEKEVKELIRPLGGHHLFEAADPPGTECPVCGWRLVFRKAKRVYMWPIGARVRNLVRNRHATTLMALQTYAPCYQAPPPNAVGEVLVLVC